MSQPIEKHSKIQNPDRSYNIKLVTDTHIILIDPNSGSMSLTNAVETVIDELNLELENGIGNRRVIYRDSMNRFDEILVQDGHFLRFAPCTEHQQTFLQSLISISQEE